MKQRHTITVKLTLQGPILVKSTSPSSFGIDAAMDRSAFGPNAGKCRIRGTAIKGKIAESLHQLNPPTGGAARDPSLDTLFGIDSGDDNMLDASGTPRASRGNEPQRSNIVFGDFHAQTPEGPENNGTSGGTAATDAAKRRTRIQIIDDLGSVAEGALQVIETPFPAGKPVVFEGHVYCWNNGDDAAKLKEKLELGLKWLTHFGANGSNGFGRLIDVAVEDTAPLSVTPTIDAPPDALDVAIQPLGPLCVSKHKIGGNLFESENFIPGNMIAGAVMQTADTLGLKSDLASFMDSIRFRHAFASKKDGGSRVGPVPLSLVRAGGKTFDAVACAGAKLHNGATPAFCLDWKDADWGAVSGALGIVRPARELLVRTAINSENRTADRGRDEEAGGKLFATEVVHPWTDSGEALVWRTKIDLSRITDANQRLKVAQDLETVLKQLGWLSKTKAVAAAEVEAASAEIAPGNIANGGRLALRLNSPALIADPRFQNVPGVPDSGALTATEMLKLYQAAWKELSGESLELIHHFSRQFLAGGNHLGFRYQIRNNRPYNPWLLTEAGSVFVFTVKNATTAKEWLKDWLNFGLTLPDWAEKTFGKTWQDLPYLPENGFGEIAVYETPQSIAAL